MRLTGGLKNRAETDVIPETVATLGKRLAGIAVAKVVNPVVTNGPCMAGGYPPRMIPYLWRDRVGKPLWKCLEVMNYVHAHENVLLAVQRVVKSGNV